MEDSSFNLPKCFPIRTYATPTTQTHQRQVWVELRSSQPMHHHLPLKKTYNNLEAWSIKCKLSIPSSPRSCSRPHSGHHHWFMFPASGVVVRSQNKERQLNRCSINVNIYLELFFQIMRKTNVLSQNNSDTAVSLLCSLWFTKQKWKRRYKPRNATLAFFYLLKLFT